MTIACLNPKVAQNRPQSEPWLVNPARQLFPCPEFLTKILKNKEVILVYILSSPGNEFEILVIAPAP